MTSNPLQASSIITYGLLTELKPALFIQVWDWTGHMDVPCSPRRSQFRNSTASAFHQQLRLSVERKYQADDAADESSR